MSIGYQTPSEVHKQSGPQKKYWKKKVNSSKTNTLHRPTDSEDDGLSHQSLPKDGWGIEPHPSLPGGKAQNLEYPSPAKRATKLVKVSTFWGKHNI